MELVWRPLTRADFPAVTALCAAAEAADDTGEHLSEEDFAQSFGQTEVVLGESLAQVPAPHEIAPFSAVYA
ncbi:hypothetical protein ABZ345_10295 [Lentzea sp. NPDC005914]|uniref:hypothetical protein n=1 Tax=Lentzea sp. NPDC005914 TaxID=3154572 RepID=UPI0033E5AD9E